LPPLAKASPPITTDSHTTNQRHATDSHTTDTDQSTNQFRQMADQPQYEVKSKEA
jgi:hypothetical protein